MIISKISSNSILQRDNAFRERNQDSIESFENDVLLSTSKTIVKNICQYVNI